MSDVPNADGSNPWQRLKFHMSLWVACLWTGNLWKYAALKAQAKLESGGNLSSRLFVEHLNPFGMKMPSKRATGGIPANDGGLYAVYGSYWGACMDRLAWDDRKGLAATYQNQRAYFQAVKDAGYATDPEYVNKWAAVYDETTGPIEKFVNAPLTGGNWFTALKVWFFFVLLVLFLLVIIYLLWKWNQALRGKGAPAQE